MRTTRLGRDSDGRHLNRRLWPRPGGPSASLASLHVEARQHYSPPAAWIVEDPLIECVPSCCAAAADGEAANESKGHAMAKMESTVTIARPVEEVFRFFLALDENAPKVDPSAGSVLKSPDRPAGPGTTFRFRQQTLGKVRETTTRFTGVEPNKKIEFEAVIGPMRPKASLTFEPADGGTRVTFRGDSNPVGPLRWLNPVFNRKGQQVWGQRLGRVKAVLEASAT